MNAQGWYSGTDHIHMNYGGNLHNTPENMMFMARGRRSERGRPTRSATKTTASSIGSISPENRTRSPRAGRILRFDEEYRPPFYGHINVINLHKHLISPFITGYEQTALESLYPSNTDIFRAAREQGAIGGYVHPWSQDPAGAGYAVARGFPVDLALGSFEYLEVLTRAEPLHQYRRRSGIGR